MNWAKPKPRFGIRHLLVIIAILSVALYVHTDVQRRTSAKLGYYNTNSFTLERGWFSNTVRFDNGHEFTVGVFDEWYRLLGYDED